MKRKTFSKQYTIDRIQDTYNISRPMAEEIYSKTYEAIRYRARSEKIKGFHSTRETFFSIFAGKDTPTTVKTYIHPEMPEGYQYEVTKSANENAYSLETSIGSRLSSLREKYTAVEEAYKEFTVDKDMGKLNKFIEEFKRTSEYMKSGS